VFREIALLPGEINKQDLVTKFLEGDAEVGNSRRLSGAAFVEERGGAQCLAYFKPL
jgi:hypothetical protein